MATGYPISSQWITFPVQLKDVKKIEWSEGSSRKSATYYTCKCYWGDLKKSSSVENSAKPRAEVGGWENLNIIGQTQLFIASEYVETSLRGGPLSNFHVKDLAEFNLTGREEDRNGWATMQLNSFFHYGQSGRKGKYKRWIVYHPPISSAFSSPKPFQHRFKGLLSADIIEAIADSLPDSAEFHSTVAKNMVKKFGVPILKLGLEGLKNVFGHHLHQFLKVAEVTEIKKPKEEKKSGNPDQVPEKKVIEPEPLSTKEVSAIQEKEDKRADAENRDDDEKAIYRAWEAMDYLQNKIEVAKQQSDFAQQIVFMDTPEKGLLFEDLVLKVVENENNSNLVDPDEGDIASVDPQGDSKKPSPQEEPAGQEKEPPQGSSAPGSDPKAQREDLVYLARPNNRKARPKNFRSRAAKQFYITQAQRRAGQLHRTNHAGLPVPQTAFDDELEEVAEEDPLHSDQKVREFKPSHSDQKVREFKPPSDMISSSHGVFARKKNGDMSQGRKALNGPTNKNQKADPMARNVKDAKDFRINNYYNFL